jgi:hypothetical protein
MVDAISKLVELQWDITVDEVRALFGFPPHPDNGTGANRGSMFIYANDPGVQVGDSTLSDQDLVDAWNLQVVTPTLAMAVGKPTHAQLEAEYPELWADAQVAASNLGAILL